MKNRNNILDDTLDTKLLCAFPEGASSQPGAGRRLSWVQHRGRTERPT
jgi:hypothetical protein